LNLEKENKMNINHQSQCVAGVRFGIIANSNAGLSNAEKNWSRLGLINRQVKMINHTVQNPDYITMIVTNDIADVSKAIVKLVGEKNVQVLFVFGGDGTLHRVLDIIFYEFYHTKNISRIPIIASLGGGTMLAVHSWLGWSRDSVEIFDTIINRNLVDLSVRKVWPLTIHFTPKGETSQEVRFGFMFVIGAIARVMREYDKERSILAGLKHFVFGASAGIFGWPESHNRLIDQFDAGIIADDDVIGHSRPLSVIASITDSLLFGIKPFRGRKTAGQFYFMSTDMTAKQLALHVPGLYRASYNPPEPILYNKPVTELVILPVEEGEFFLDGDFYFLEQGTKIFIKTAPCFTMVERF
jgi:hypothetical protein